MNIGNLSLAIAKDLKQLAGSIEILAKAIDIKADMEADGSKDEPITIEKVRAVLAEKSQSGKQPQVKALIIKYGANKLTDINPAYYQEMLKEAEVL